MPVNNYQRFHNGLHVLNGVILDTDTDIYSEFEGVYGWRDLVTPLELRGTNSPTWKVFRDGIYAYAFPASANKEVFTTFHIDHDYALGTKIYPHVHFAVNTTSTGTIKWGFEYTVAKGHDQQQFGPTTTIYVTTTISSNKQYIHFVAEPNEANAIPPTNLEPDSIVLMRVFRDTTDTFTGDVFGFSVDLHYQVGRLFTKNKAPNFYT